MMEPAHVTLSGDLSGDHVVEDRRPDGRVVLRPDLSVKASVQRVKMKGALAGCSGGGAFTGAKYTATLKTAHAVSCETLSSGGEQAAGPLVVTWLPKAKNGVSNGTLSLLVSEAGSKPITGALESGPFASSSIAGTISQTFKNASTCGLATATKPAKPVKSATFTGSPVTLY